MNSYSSTTYVYSYIHEQIVRLQFNEKNEQSALEIDAKFELYTVGIQKNVYQVAGPKWKNSLLCFGKIKMLRPL